MSKGKDQFVVPTNGGWGVRGAGNEKLTKVCKTQKDAIEVAKNIAMNQQSELIVLETNGKIRLKNTYGNDPFPPRG